MMLYPAINDLEKVTHNRYAIVIITAKRARQLLEQSENNKVPLSDKPVKLAIEDIASGKVRCKSVTENDVQTSNEQAPSEIKPEK